MIKMRVSQPSVKMQVSSPSVHMEIEPTKVVYMNGGGGNVSSEQVDRIVVLDRGEYEALAVKDTKTVYLIRG